MLTRVIPLSLALCAIVVARAFAQNAPPEPIALTLGLTPGQTARYGFQEVETIINHSEKIKDGVMPSQFQTEAQVQFRTLDRTQEGLTVEMVYQRIRFQADSRVLKEPPSFDTAAPAEEARENPFAPALLAVVNKPITLHLAASGAIQRIDSPAVEIPDVKFAGVAERMLTAEWITQRFQPVFSLTAPGASAPANLWTVSSEVPVAHGLAHAMRVHTTHVVREASPTIVNIDLAGKAELLPATTEADAKTRLVSFTGVGNAVWNKDMGLLGMRNYKCDWKLDTLPQPDLPTHVDVSVQMLLMSLK